MTGFLFPSLGPVLPSDVSMKRLSIVASGNTDWDNIQASGFYAVLIDEFNQYKNNPATKEDGVLEVFICGNVRVQRCTYASGVIFSRVYSKNAWSSWASNDIGMSISTYVK